jgi:hypothetical protein
MEYNPDEHFKLITVYDAVKINILGFMGNTFFPVTQRYAEDYQAYNTLSAKKN